jgi:YD repeat-containing protein
VGPSVISRYCRVKAYLEGDGSVTPVLERLEFSYSGTLDSVYQTFGYDLAGNLTQKQRSTSAGTVTETRSYNNLNEIVDNEIDDGSTPVVWTYAHDDNGNLVSKTDGTDLYEYTWDDQNRLIQVELNSAPVVTYEYDSASRMVQRTEGGTTTNYTWDGWDLIREEKTGTVTETTDYLVPFGEVLALERGGDWYYLHGDALSSTQLVTDESGHIVGRYIYGAWGEEL